MNKTKAKRVGIIASNEGALFELGCAIELFALPRSEVDHWYQCQVISLQTGPLSYTGSVGLNVNQVADFNGFDMLVVPHWNPAAEQSTEDHYAQYIARAAASGCRVISFCSGAFLLAAAGLLNGRDATTHWRYAEHFRQRYPQIKYHDNVLYCFDGAVGCSAGSAAGLDLGLEVIRQDYGRATANKVARRLVMSAQRQGGQAQFVETPVATNTGQFSATLDWALEHLHLPLTVDELATKANMSRRTFDRSFRGALGMSANQWLINQRLQVARQCLEETSLPLDRIAELSGFNNAITLRHHFNRKLGVSPSTYRAQFAANA